MSDAAATLDANATVKAVPVSVRRTVCYEFDTGATKADLALPYLVIIDNKVQGKPRQLSSAKRKITVEASAGSKVALYLNSDVHPDHRRNPVYAVLVEEHDIVVKITEQQGNKEYVEPVVGEGIVRPPQSPGVRSAMRHAAKLTGDIWMLISHRYTEAEAETLLASTTDAVVRKAVCSIYRGLGVPKLDIPQLIGNDVLHISFLKQDNPHLNIKNTCTLLGDVLPRTHPYAFAALFSVARNLGLSEVHVTSCWRPSLGSIAHRAGLGLDVNLIADISQQVKINRAGLREKGPSKNPNVTDREKELFVIAEEKEAIAKKNQYDPYAAKDARGAKDDWRHELNGNEPKIMHDLRDSLEKERRVGQILDPWYVELNTNQPNSRKPNEQKTVDEKFHNHHLHITIKEPGIYE